MQEALARPELISLAAGFVDPASLPVEAVRTASEQVLLDPDSARTALQYGSTPGDPELRELIRARHLEQNGGDEKCPALEQVVVTAGSNQLLHLVSDTLLDPGDVVLCTSPSYFVFLGGLANLGAHSVGIATDRDGMVPEALEEALKSRAAAGDLGRVKAIYITSYFDNPCSITLSASRRGQIVQIAERYSGDGTIYVIDDTAYRELRYEGDDAASLRWHDPEGRTVIHTGSFSKSFAPGLRVGWGILPPELVEPVCNQKGNIDFGSPQWNQRVIANVLKLGLFEPHVEKIRKSYHVKATAMLDALDTHLGDLPDVEWIHPQGGLYIWLAMPKEIDTGAQGTLFRRALDEGTLYVPGVHCYPAEGEPPRHNMIRLSFGVQPTDRITLGIEALGRALRDVLE